MGTGFSPRTRLCMARAGSRQSIRPSSRDILGAGDASPCCGRGRMPPAATRSTVRISRSAPRWDRRSCSSPAVSSGPIGTVSWQRISPASTRFSIRKVVTPVTSSPLITAHCIGAAPRCLGRREGCRLTAPRGGISSSAAGRMRKATTTNRSAFRARSASRKHGSRSFSGCQRGIPWRWAASFTGDEPVFNPRPRGRSGPVTIPATSCSVRPISASRPGTANSGVPM